MPIPAPHATTADLVAQARREAHVLAGPARVPRPPADLTAAALRTHSALSAGLGQHIPVTVLGRDGDGVRGLATFLAVYAAARHAPRRGGVRRYAAAGRRCWEQRT